MLQELLRNRVEQVKPFLQRSEELMTAMQFIPQEPAQNCTEEQIVDVRLSQLQEEIVEEQEPMSNDTVDQVVDVLALQVQETVEVNMAIPDGRMSESIL